MNCVYMNYGERTCKSRLCVIGTGNDGSLLKRRRNDTEFFFRKKIGKHKKNEMCISGSGSNNEGTISLVIRSLAHDMWNKDGTLSPGNYIFGKIISKYSQGKKWGFIRKITGKKGGRYCSFSNIISECLLKEAFEDIYLVENYAGVMLWLVFVLKKGKRSMGDGRPIKANIIEDGRLVEINKLDTAGSLSLGNITVVYCAGVILEWVIGEDEDTCLALSELDGVLGWTPKYVPCSEDAWVIRTDLMVGKFICADATWFGDSKAATVGGNRFNIGLGRGCLPLKMVSEMVRRMKVDGSMMERGITGVFSLYKELRILALIDPCDEDFDDSWFGCVLLEIKAPPEGSRVLWCDLDCRGRLVGVWATGETKVAREAGRHYNKYK